MCCKSINSNISNVGSAALSENQVKPRDKYLPELSQMNFVVFTKNDKHLIPLENHHDLWNETLFNPSYKTEIMVTGWTSNINETNDALETIWQAYKCRGNVNFIVSLDDLNMIYYNKERL